MATRLAPRSPVPADPRRADPDFAAGSSTIPTLLGEFALASRSFPILFAIDGDGIEPVVLTGLDDRNVFLRRDGNWDPTVYLPVYVRRYPFGLVARDEAHPDDLALAIDTRLEGIDASAVMRRALAFREAFHRDARDTREFCATLRERGLLVPNRAHARLGTLGPSDGEGLHLVDVVKFVALQADDVLEWNRKGWLAGVYLHLISLRRIHDLRRRACGVYRG